MTLGSAAFLPGPAPATPQPLFRNFRPTSLAGTAPPGRSPAALAADDQPRGRILVAQPETVVDFDLQRLLRGAGYRVVGPASTADEARRLIDRRPVDGALVDLDLDPPTGRAIADLMDRAGIPVVFLSGTALAEPPEGHRDRPLVHKPYTGAALLGAVRRALEKAADDDVIHYRLSPPPMPWPRVMPQL
jgi:CheY-like chemotaxis protein